MTADLFNALFEMAGALLTLMNTVQIRRDKGYAGVYMPAIVLFTSWGFWNLYYYAHLAQWWSVAATVVMVLANLSWLGHMLWYGKK
jgi:membrane protein YdbS with pleckstrin-like domain